MIKKKMAEVIFANNLYHVSLIEQYCSLPADAEELLSSSSLANPEDCPVYSASKDPDDYKMKSTSYSQDPQYSTFTSKNPFGALPGYRTIQVVVSVHATPVKGYIYCPEARRYSLLLSTQWGAGQEGDAQGPEGGRGKEGKKPHSLP